MKPLAMFKPSDELTFQTVQLNRERFVNVLTSHQDDDVSVNLSQVNVCDSAGIALLLELKRLGLAQKKTVTMVDVSPLVDSWVEFCGIKPLL